MEYVKVSKTRGATGLVTAPDGRRLGKVTKHARVIAGTGGARGTCYTASAVNWQGSEEFVGASLGTRHPTKASAARAIRMFWGWMDTQLESNPYRASARFKALHPEVCAIGRV